MHAERKTGDRPPPASDASVSSSGAHDLLSRFADAVRTHDSKGLAQLFTADGCYDDGLFGLHTGREAIAATRATCSATALASRRA